MHAQLQHKTKVAEPVMAPEAVALGLPMPLAMAGQHIDDVPVAFRLEDLPDADLTGAMLQFTSGGAAGHNVWISGVRNGYVTTGIGQVHFDSLRGVAAGDEVLIDNTAYLAFQTYHRHQVPPDDYPEWDQFRAAGRPIYPQRPELLGPRYARNGGAGLQSGRFDGKMIVVQCLLDEGAYPQQADWYRRRVEAVLGPRIDDQLPALVRRPCDARRARRPAGRDDASRRGTRGSSTTAACWSRRCGTWPRGRNATPRRPPARTTSSSTARSSSRRARPTAGASSRS